MKYHTLIFLKIRKDVAKSVVIGVLRVKDVEEADAESNTGIRPQFLIKVVTYMYNRGIDISEVNSS